jgi:hypothetical protein
MSHTGTLHLILTLNLLTSTIVAPPSNASKWQMGFNSAFKGLRSFGGEIRFTSSGSYYSPTLYRSDEE